MKKNLEHDPLTKEIIDAFETSGPIEDALETLSSGDRLDKDPEFVADSAKMQIIEDILRAMKNQGLSKNELAKRMGTSRQYLSKILNEDEDINFTIETMASISCALGKKLEIRIVSSDEAVTEIEKCREALEISQKAPRKIARKQSKTRTRISGGSREDNNIRKGIRNE